MDRSGWLRLAALALCLSFSTAAAAQPAYRVKDLNTTATGGTDLWPGAGQFVELGGSVLFNVADGIHGTEIWKTDGTAAGTALVKDICPGACSAGFYLAMMPFGTAIYFSADDGAHGTELWKTDGTAAGTVMVKELQPGLIGSGARPLGVVNGALLLSVNDGVSGRELWKTDGTAAGTSLLADLEPGAGSSAPEALAVVGGQLFFSAATSAHGTELWVTDGTATGTGLVMDINPGAGHSLVGGPPFPAASFLTVAAGKLFFAADDGTHGTELWASDGTAGGTAMVADILSGSDGSFPARMVTLGTSFVFSAFDETNGRELWVSDGTEAGTTLVKDIYPGTTGSGPAEPVVLGGQVFFIAADGTHGRELWKSDGTEAGTVLVKDVATGTGDAVSPFAFGALTPLGSQVLFFAQDGTHGTELWTSDGSEAGTTLLADIVPGAASSWFGETIGFDFRVVSGGRWYFRVYSSDIFQGREVWTSDGTPAGTHLLKEINSQTSAFDVLRNGALWGPKPMTDVAGTLFFHGGDGAAGFELSKSDGTAAGTGVVADLFPGEGQSVVQHLTGLGGLALFSADDGLHGSELWASDGTAAGTSMIADLEGLPSGSPDDYPQQLVRLGGEVLFAGTGGLWKTDGTPGGTVEVRNGLEMMASAVLGSEVLFAGLGDSCGVEPWKSDGTDPGTLRVKDIRPGADSSAPGSLVVTSGGGSMVFFSADDGSAGRELWKSDGTEDGTVLVKDIAPGTGSGILMGSNYPEGGEIALAAAGSIVFFLADDGVAGEELWKSDGTEAGTVLVKDIFPGAGSAEIRWLTAVGARVFFVADDGVHGRELWVSDGTMAGTVLVEDILPGAGSSLPAELSAHEGILLFSAHDSLHGREPWRSDGTAAGTWFLQDIAPGILPSTPLHFTRSGSRVYFAATDATTGFELWALPASYLASEGGFYTVTPCRAINTQLSTPLASGVSRTFALAGTCGIPADAVAVAANLTVVSPGAGGFVVAWPAGTPIPGTSNLNFNPGQTRAASSILSLSATGLAARATLAGGGTVHLLVDVVGYFK